ncbi:exodeoxyribonuclease III [Arthrobacter sp. RIT-PI-e]|uniref:exodeoxyribonuclease III n=1 Tax=Arthrobacter sp. RIT-PI-e TaxID=1681197 RepID=UPI0009E4A416|nr:exodeoxyribonuclease III [Arthrobacter sp. RIT-PI-e]
MDRVSPASPPSQTPLRIASVNVNGVRAAYRRGMQDWLSGREVDVLCLQEVRAPDAELRRLLGEDWHIVHTEAEAKGRAGVAIASRTEPTATRTTIGDPFFDTSGRWVEMDLQVRGVSLTVVSAYVHSGEAGTPKQEDKYRFLDAMTVRLPQLRDGADHAVVVGDLNVGHTPLDIRNWKGNLRKAGFLEEERAYFDRFFSEECGFLDVARLLAGDVDGPYTWWSWRGKAFDNDTGWRIDYQLATSALARNAASSTVDRAPSWEARFSDHAPLVVDYQI